MYVYQLFIYIKGTLLGYACAVGWGTALQTCRSRGRFPMGSFGSCNDL